MLTLPTQFRTHAPQTVLGGDVVFSEHAVTVLRRWLRDAGLDEWRIFHGSVPHLHGMDNVLEKLDPDAVWESADLALAGEEPLAAMTFEDDPHPATRAWPGGVVHLRAMQVVVARWYWYDFQHRCLTAIYFVAAPRWRAWKRSVNSSWRCTAAATSRCGTSGAITVPIPPPRVARRTTTACCSATPSADASKRKSSAFFGRKSGGCTSN
ncbi:MAG: hypothetical protein QM754_01585 [Tepidisphaeraceae bacterium]